MNAEDKDVLAGFAERMHEICDDMGLPAGRGRQSAMAAEHGVTNKAARKWLLGLGFPELVLAFRIANWADVNLTWLLHGSVPKRGNRVDTKALVLDEAIRRLPPDMGIDLVDNLRATLERIGKLTAQEPSPRYRPMLDAYEAEFNRKRH